jgi:hypothetical protein
MPQPECGKGFRPSDCPAEGQIVVYGKEGQFTLEGLGPAGGTIMQY